MLATKQHRPNLLTSVIAFNADGVSSKCRVNDQLYEPHEIRLSYSPFNVEQLILKWKQCLIMYLTFTKTFTKYILEILNYHFSDNQTNFYYESSFALYCPVSSFLCVILCFTFRLFRFKYMLNVLLRLMNFLSSKIVLQLFFVKSKIILCT